MKSPSFLNYENLKFGRFSQLLKAKFQNNVKSSSVEDLINELTSSEFEKKLKILVKNDLARDYSLQTIEEGLNKISFFILQENEIETPFNEPRNEIPEPKIKYIVENEKIDEILKVQKRVPRWFKNPNQINAKILLAYMELLGDNNSVSYYKLETSCRSLETFKNNYIQMKSFGERNHAKVFTEIGSLITLWEPTREYIKKEYVNFIKRRSNTN
jgi:hypothetical protein